MNLIELNRFYDLIGALSRINELLENLRAAAYPAPSSLSGMPHVPGVKDKIGDLAVEIADLEIRKSYIEKEIARNKEVVEDYCQGISDYFTRTIFRLRFVRGLSWKEVAATVGGKNTEDGVKSVCYRYLKKHAP